MTSTLSSAITSLFVLTVGSPDTFSICTNATSSSIEYPTTCASYVLPLPPTSTCTSSAPEIT